MTSPIRDGFHAGMPCLRVREVEQAVEFYKRAFGARELSRVLLTGGRGPALVQLRIGGLSLLVAATENELPGDSACRTVMHVQVEDVEGVFWRAVDAGATVAVPLQEVFWGGRYGQLSDPFGYQWALSSHGDEGMPAEMRRRARAAFAETQEASIEHGVFGIRRGGAAELT